VLLGGRRGHLGGRGNGKRGVFYGTQLEGGETEPRKVATAATAEKTFAVAAKQRVGNFTGKNERKRRKLRNLRRTRKQGEENK